MLLLRTLRGTPLSLVSRHSLVLRSAPIRPFTRANVQLFKSSSRFETTSTQNKTANTEAAVSKPSSPSPSPSQPPPPKLAFGPSLCVYHAGTGRTAFLACLKVSTLFILAFFGFLVTPNYFEKEGLSLNVVRFGFSALVPVVFVAYTTAPFVTFIHMRLPPFARQSEEMLRRYVRNLPPQTELEITTMSFIAKPRMSTVKISDLVPVSRRYGIVNLARDTTAENAARKWYMFRAVGNFNVQSRSGVKKAPWVWDVIWKTINSTRSL